MTIKSEMTAALLRAQQDIADALAALETANDDGRNPMFFEAESADRRWLGDDARIKVRAAYHALKPIAWPQSTDPLDAIPMED